MSGRMPLGQPPELMRDVVEIDADICIGSGECMLAAPKVFRVNESGVGTVLPGALTGDLAEAELVRIIRQCPSQAIRTRPAVGSR